MASDNSLARLVAARVELRLKLLKETHLPGCPKYSTALATDCTCGSDFRRSVYEDVLKTLEAK